jgi:hypothetical protein
MDETGDPLNPNVGFTGGQAIQLQLKCKKLRSQGGGGGGGGGRRGPAGFGFDWAFFFDQPWNNPPPQEPTVK